MTKKQRNLPLDVDVDLLSKGSLTDRSGLLSFLIECQARHGDYLCVHKSSTAAMFLLTDPAAVRHVLVAAHENFIKPVAFAVEMAPLFGEGILTSKGDQWRRQRQVSQPIFQSQQMPGFFNVIQSCTDNLLSSWQRVAPDSLIDFYKEMLHLTNTISVELVYGADCDDSGALLKSELVHTLFKMKTQKENSNDGAAKLIFEFQDLVMRLVTRRLSQGEAFGDDLLSVYAQAANSTSPTRLSEQELLDDVKTLTIGGHHNLAAALSWTFYLLAENHEIRHKFHDELNSKLSGGPPSLSLLADLNYLSAIIQESMRLYPPVWIITREAVSDGFLEGYEIPGGSMVILCPWITHRHPSYWASPDTFAPERFSGTRAAEINKFAYFPFGKGPRQCIAQDLSFLSMLLIAARIGQTYELNLPDGWKAEIEPAYVLAPKGGLPVRLNPRN